MNEVDARAVRPYSRMGELPKVVALWAYCRTPLRFGGNVKVLKWLSVSVKHDPSLSKRGIMLSVKVEIFFLLSQ